MHARRPIFSVLMNVNLAPLILSGVSEPAAAGAALFAMREREIFIHHSGRLYLYYKPQLDLTASSRFLNQLINVAPHSTQ